jgi:Flp pilus assembly protein TadD
MQVLEPPDSHHLEAAHGWLGLGSVADARTELEAISPGLRGHPAVLEARWLVCVQEKNWRDALAVAERELAGAPENSSGWLHRAYALRRVEGGGLTQAWDALLPAAEKFPKEPTIPYNLSCYACQLQQLDMARHWLNRAIAAGKKECIKLAALCDDDLKPLWTEIKDL